MRGERIDVATVEYDLFAERRHALAESTPFVDTQPCVKTMFVGDP
jgi:hypothetical protein